MPKKFPNDPHLDDLVCPRCGASTVSVTNHDDIGAIPTTHAGLRFCTSEDCMLGGFVFFEDSEDAEDQAINVTNAAMFMKKFTDTMTSAALAQILGIPGPSGISRMSVPTRKSPDDETEGEE